MDLHWHWPNLLSWLSHHGMDVANLNVEPRLTSGGFGLFTLKSCPPSSPLFTVPGSTMMNIRTLSPHYPPGLTAVQLISLHLLLHRPEKDQTSLDPLFGPYIDSLPSDFDYHPLMRLTREGETFLDLLPPSSVVALEKLANRFHTDLEVIRNYLHSHADVVKSSSRSRFDARIDGDQLQSEYLWAWLNVNTRCIYHRLIKSRSDPDNLTLCPILDFANHTSQPIHIELNPSCNKIGSSGKGIRFSVLSPKITVDGGKEVFLTYGAHCNRVLFVEYGFVIPSTSGDCIVEVQVDDIVEKLFAKKKLVGTLMLDTLQTENYYKDWTIHYHQGSAYPSYRLVTALRLYELMLKGSIPPNYEELIQPWRLTLSGMQDEVSVENENAWKETLSNICCAMINRTENWFKIRKDAGFDIETLWREEKYVSQRVLDSIENGENLV